MENIPLWLYEPYNIPLGCILSLVAYLTHDAFKRLSLDRTRALLEEQVDRYRQKTMFAQMNFQRNQTFKNRVRFKNYAYISLVYTTLLEETYK